MEKSVTERNFKRLLLVYFAMQCVLSVLSFSYAGEKSSQIFNISILSKIALPFFCGVLLVSLYGYYALYNFKNAGRWIFTAVVLLSLVPLYANNDYSALPSWSLSLGYACTLIEGILLFAIWASPLSRKFAATEIINS